MGRAGDDRSVDPFDPGVETGYLRRAPRDHQLEPELGAHPFDPDPEPQLAEVVPLPRRGPSMAERLERERLERERIERERRARVERERAERERAERERREARRRKRAEKLRREREALQRRRRPPERAAPRAPRQRPARPRPAARVQPGVQGPVRRRHGLFWPTAKAGFAITVVLGLSAALGSLVGLPVPGMSVGAGTARLANSADLFGIDPGTPAGLSAGYLFPIEGAHAFGDKLARFGAPRYGHIHEGQDIFAKSGTPEVAVHDGVVVDRGKNSDPDSGGRGNFIAIYSANDNRSFVYMHMLKPATAELGDSVHAGEVIGQVGCTGECDGAHLHFEVRIGRASLGADTKPADPLPYLRQWPQATPG